MGRRRVFSREFKTEAVRLVLERGVTAFQDPSRHRILPPTRSAPGTTGLLPLTPRLTANSGGNREARLI
jgi:hypothetical protein